MKHHIPNLDGLRGLAVLSVVLSHAAKAGLLPAAIFGHALGEYGVMVFFSLSGFLIAYLYLQENFTRHEIYTYAVSRFSRVYPLFALAVLLHWLLFMNDIIPSIPIDTPDLFLHLALLKGENIFWTISPEFQFYVFFILLWFFHAKAQNAYALPTIIALLFITNTMLHYGGNKTALPYSLNFFLSGTLAACIYTKHSASLKNHTRGIEFYFLALLFILSLPPLYRLIFEQEQLKFLSPINALIAGGITLFAALGGKYLDGFLSHKSLRWLGAISFSLYLLHMPLLDLIKTAPYNSYWLLLPYLAIALAVSTASYTLLEKPMRAGIKKALLR